MAHKKTGGIAKNGRSANPKHLGIKHYKHNLVKPGYIIAKQKGTTFKPGQGVKTGKTRNIHANITGTIKIINIHNKPYINVIPITAQKILTSTRNYNESRNRTCDL